MFTSIRKQPKFVLRHTPNYFLTPIAGDPFKRLIGIDDPITLTLDFDQQYGGRTVPKRLCEFLLRPPQRIFRPLAFGDVFDEAFDVERTSVLSANFPAT